MQYQSADCRNVYQNLTDLIRPLVGDEISVDFPELISYMYQPCGHIHIAIQSVAFRISIISGTL